MTKMIKEQWLRQQERNQAVLDDSIYMKNEYTSDVLPLKLDLSSTDGLTKDQANAFRALEVKAARIAIQSVTELSKLGEVDHMGGGLDLIPSLLVTLASIDSEKKDYTIEHAHTSIGYYSALAALGYISPERVISVFRQSLDVPGHVSWVPGGTQLNGGRLGVMIPAAVGQALGKKANYGDDAFVLCHCGDAGWVSGQALNGFNLADFHGAPVSFVMHRNGIQLSGSNKAVFNKDPRKMISAMGITVLEIDTLHDASTTLAAYREAYSLAKAGKPSLIYPTGTQGVQLSAFAKSHGITEETTAMAEKNGVDMNTNIWVPGALMSYRDVESMLECVFLVNELPGGKGHHDGHMNGRDCNAVLANPMLTASAEEDAALAALDAEPKMQVTTVARPAAGTENLILSDEALAAVELPAAGKVTSARAGVQKGYEAVAKAFPDSMFVIDADLAPSTKVDKARAALAENRQFEVSIEEQVATIMANGLAVATRDPQLVVFGTFSAFFEGIAREGFEMWRYQRNLNGVNEGLNVTMHLSHVGACTGRDHFSGWSLDWVNLGIGYIPYLHRFYAPADARMAFVAIRDLAANYGAHILAIPRDNLPVLTKQDGSALWNADSEWENITTFRQYEGAKKAVIAFGAPAYLAQEVAEDLNVDAYIVNALPLVDGEMAELVAKYPEGVATIEDGLIAYGDNDVQGFAGLVRASCDEQNVPFGAVGIVDPRIAPSEGHKEIWEHFGITAEALSNAVKAL